MMPPADPRLAATTVVQGAPGILPGDELVRVEQVEIDGQVVMLPVALPGIPDYIAAAESESKADELRPLVIEDLDVRGETPYQPNTEVVFEFYAAAASAVTAAVAGLESYTNHHIGRYADANGAVNYRGESQTRRRLSDLPLNDRLSDVLPEIVGRPAPTQESWWPTLRRVQGIAALSRHGVSHPTKRAGLVGERSLTQRYCDREYRGAAGMMLDVFEYFAPGWVDAQRLGRLPRPPD